MLRGGSKPAANERVVPSGSRRASQGPAQDDVDQIDGRLTRPGHRRVGAPSRQELTLRHIHDHGHQTGDESDRQAVAAKGAGLLPGGVLEMTVHPVLVGAVVGTTRYADDCEAIGRRGDKIPIRK